MHFKAKGSFSRLMVIAIGATLLLFFIGGIWFFKAQQKHQRESVEANLRSIAKLKAKQIADWRAERMADATILLGRPGLIESIERFFSEPTDQENSEILQRLRPVKELYHFKGIFIVNLKKMVVLSLGSDVGLCPEHADVMDEAISRRRPLWTPLHVSSEYPYPHLSIIVPLSAESGVHNPIGAIVLVCDASQFLYPLIQSWPTPSATAETLLIRKDGNDVLFLNELRHRKDTALKLRIPLSRKDLPAAKAVDGVTGIVEGKDYRGVKVIAAILPVPDSPWFMVSKVDTQEAFAEMRFRSTLILVSVLGMMVLVLATGFVIWQRNLKTYYQELYQSEASLNKALKLHQVTLHSIGDAVITTDSEGRVELMNPVAENLTGWKQEESKSQALSKVFHIVNEETRQPVKDPASRVLKEGKIVGLANHTLLIAKDGREIPISDSGSPIRGENDEMIGVVMVFKDQTIERQYQSQLKEHSERLEELVEARTKELKDAQEQLVRKEKLSVLGQLAGGVGHELRNPLGVISNAVYYLKMVLPDAEENIKEYLQTISSEVERSTKIVSDLLDFSRIKSIDKKPVVIWDLISQVLDQRPAPEKIEIISKIPADLTPAFVDPRQIIQVLDNLINNAYQAMNQGGKLTLEAETHKNEIHVSVTDTGCGISQENMKNIFEPLFTTKARGIGLGLAVSKNLMEANDGSLEVSSAEGKGTTFKLIIPVKESQA